MITEKYENVTRRCICSGVHDIGVMPPDIGDSGQYLLCNSYGKMGNIVKSLDDYHSVMINPRVWYGSPNVRDQSAKAEKSQHLILATKDQYLVCESTVMAKYSFTIKRLSDEPK